MKQISLAIIGVIIVVIGIVLFGTLYTVNQREQVADIDIAALVDVARVDCHERLAS